MVHKTKFFVMRFWGDEPLKSEYIKIRKKLHKFDLSTRSLKRATQEAKEIKEGADEQPYPFVEGYSGVVVKGNKPIKIFSSGERAKRPHPNYMKDIKEELKRG